MSHRITDLVLSVLACAAAALLSWPFWRSAAYWADTRVAWLFYVTIGFLLSIPVFYLFVGCVHLLFVHEAQAREQAVNNQGRPS